MDIAVAAEPADPSSGARGDAGTEAAGARGVESQVQVADGVGQATIPILQAAKGPLILDQELPAGVD